ncbi:MAG: outer membrane protein assembly factor BamD [Chitinophagales bacterium]
MNKKTFEHRSWVTGIGRSSLTYRLFSFTLISIAYCFLLTISSCDTPEKVLKSNDLEFKKNKAIYWYNKKEYFKCIPVMEELIGLMKGRESTEELYYMYSNANYKQGDYMISAYHFKNFYDLYPNSIHSEEALFMQGKSFQMLSPKPDLDQTYTYKALEAYQFFLNMFPESQFVTETNANITKLRKKLEKKALNAAELYYKTENYKAAATSYESILVNFPDIEESEKVSFMIVKARNKYAQNSIPSKKAERYNNVIKSYVDFKYKFSNSKYITEAQKYEQQSHFLAVKAAFDWADVAPLTDRERYFNIAFVEAKKQLPSIIEKNETDQINFWIERGTFMIVKNNYLLSEEKKSTEKLPSLEQTVKTYYNFVDQFPKSRYIKEAERIYNNSNELIKKLKTNG